MMQQKHEDELIFDSDTSPRVGTKRVKNKCELYIFDPAVKKRKYSLNADFISDCTTVVPAERIEEEMHWIVDAFAD